MARSRHSVISTKTFDSIDSIDGGGSLYPDQTFSPSIRTENSLWRQYSLIEEQCAQKIEGDGICCSNDKLRPWLLRASFLAVTFLGVFCSMLAIRFNVYTDKSLIMTGGDQILLPVSTYFNKEIIVQTTDKNESKGLMLYLLNDTPGVSSGSISIQTGGVFYLASWTYEYWGLYLLRGTTLEISICSDLNLQFYIIKGEKKLKQWTQETIFTEYDFHTSIHPKQSCHGKKNFVTNRLTVSHSDMYYLFFTTSVGWRFLTQITVILNFNRTYYDLSKSTFSCSLGETSCHVPLAYASDNIAVLYAPAEEISPFQRIKILNTAVPRWSFYLKLYGGIYGSIVCLTVIYTIYRTISNAYSKTISLERRPLLPNQVAYQRAYSYSLRSAIGSERGARKNAWVIISPVGFDDKSDKYIFEIRDRDNESLFSRGESHRERLHSDASVESRHSNFMRSRSVTQIDNLRRQQQFLDDQQLLDSVMTSAGVSAI